MVGYWLNFQPEILKIDRFADEKRDQIAPKRPRHTFFETFPLARDDAFGVCYYWGQKLVGWPFIGVKKVKGHRFYGEKR